MSTFKQKLEKIINISRLEYEKNSPGFMIKTIKQEYTPIKIVNQNNIDYFQQTFKTVEKPIYSNIIIDGSINLNYQLEYNKSKLMIANDNSFKTKSNLAVKKITPLNLNLNSFSSNIRNSITERNAHIITKNENIIKNNFKNGFINKPKKFYIKRRKISNFNNEGQILGLTSYEKKINSNKEYSFLNNNEDKFKKIKDNCLNSSSIDNINYPKNYNKLREKIDLMKKECIANSVQNIIINRPIRTLKSPLYQFNSDSFNYISPTIRLNKKKLFQRNNNQQYSSNGFLRFEPKNQNKKLGKLGEKNLYSNIKKNNEIYLKLSEKFSNGKTKKDDLLLRLNNISNI